ncbi:hypothetical protein FIV42_01340 [Persicimonas caeni]|uniref:Site-specific recombinase n=1 Tax=Persicimonas caeni TaxID=2292766 RepID=A0A4Y6PM84_PERCE|nr:hypothetical protein [Persicimonas caeni]QDG49426.1 hypothetical protein FIV42_01340 [Persicimonas caeni]QED30647.1 hypothetical protein FRD00_01335 [Persicimonas caeni]
MYDEIRHVFEVSSGTEALRGVVDVLREAAAESEEGTDGALRELVDVLQNAQPERAALEVAVRQVLRESRLVHALAESGILADVSVFKELRNRLARRALPAREHPDDVRGHIRAIFYRSDDWEWVLDASEESWAAVLALLVDEHDAAGHADRELLGAVLGLAQRIGALGIDEELNAKLYEVEDYESPFLDLSIEAHEFLEDHRAGPGSDDSFRKLLAKIRQCRDIVLYLRDNKAIYGTSLRLTALSRRLLQQLDRLELLAHLVHPQSKRDFVQCSVRLFRSLVESTQTANSVSRLVKESADLLAFQITEESARKGQKYITDSKRGYWAFLRASMQGGAIVAVFAFIKVFLDKLPLSLAAEALAFSINYSVCFVLLYLTGSILATKQPAVLAPAIARKMDEAASEQGALEGVADVIILAWRSQFVSFLGNLICAVPVAWLIGYGLDHWLSMPAADTAKAAQLLGSVHPWESGAFYYAGVAGVFLFLAGVIAGATQNHVIYADIEQRLANHPGLAFLGDRRQKLAAFVAKNLAMINGNVALGFFLGCAGSIGIILGLPFDIRHIAFSSANVGMAIYAAPQLITAEVATVAALGVIGIGFFNFLISFLLTMSMGLESRQVTFRQTRSLAFILLKRLIRQPWEWFVPYHTSRYSLR